MFFVLLWLLKNDFFLYFWELYSAGIYQEKTHSTALHKQWHWAKYNWGGCQHNSTEVKGIAPCVSLTIGSGYVGLQHDSLK